MSIQQHVALQTAYALTRSHPFRRLFLGVRQIPPEQSVLTHRNPITVLEGKAQICDRAVALQIGFDKFFPNNLPLIYLVQEDSLGFLPHVEIGGFICYAQQEGLILNRHSPEGIVEEALRQAIQTLEEGIQGKNAADFIDELESYWMRTANARFARAFVSPGPMVREIVVAQIGNQDQAKYLFIADDPHVVQAYLNGEKPVPHTIRNALFVPLCKEAQLVPPHHKAFWTIQQTREYVWANLTEENRHLLRKVIKKYKLSLIHI